MKKVYLAIMFCTLLCFLISQINFAQAISPGVSPGNEFIYDIKFFWDSSNQSAIIRNEILDINSTDFFKLTITDVQDKEVSFQTIWRFINGTEIEGEGSINVETGSRSGDFWPILGSNLNSGDRIRPMGFDRTIINDTITRNYGPGGNRDTNLVDLTFTYYNENDPSLIVTEYSKTYFDKQTGALVEISEITVLSEPLTTETLTWKLKETNIWIVPEFPSVLILSLFMISSLVGLIYFKNRNKNVTKIFT
jgi:hypothetical protein